MNFAIEKDTKIRFGNKEGVIQHCFVDTGKLVIALSNGDIINKSKECLLQLYDRGDLTFGNAATTAGSKHGQDRAIYFEKKLTDKQRSEIKRKKGYVESCIMDGRLISEHDCDLSIRQHALHMGDKACPSVKTVRTWAHRYLACCGDSTSLLARSSDRGNRKSKLPTPAKDLMVTMVKSQFLRRNGYSTQQTCEAINAELDRHPDKYGVSSISYKTVNKYIHSLDESLKMSRRSGYKKFRNEFPSGIHREEVEYLLERVEIDQTQLNIYVVDAKTGEVIGRPWLTMGIDVTSGMIVWFHISMKRLDGDMLPRILFMAMRPKDMKSIRNKFKKIKSDWPVHGIFQEVVLDNSLENHTHDFQAVCTDILSIQLHYVPPRQGSLKPHIERMFGYVKTSFTTHFSGSYANDDEDQEAKKKAILTMDELIENFSIWVLDKYHNKYQDRLRMSPLEKWKECIELHGSTRLPNSIKDIEQLQWRSNSATLQKWGMQFDRLRYKSPELMSLARRIGFGKLLRFYYNPFDLSHINVVDPETKELIPAQCNRKEYRCRVVTYEEHQEVLRIINEDKKLRAMNPEEALTQAINILHQSADESHKRANAKVRRQKAQKSAITSDKLMNGSTVPRLMRKKLLVDFAPWLSKK